MAERYVGPKTVRIVGRGGQGAVTAGTLLGRAASLYGGLEVIQTTFYGPEIRGGEAGTDLVISSEPLYEWVITEPDILVCLWQGAYDKYVALVPEGGLVLADQDLVRPTVAFAERRRHYLIPALRMADELGNRVLANVVMLGAMLELSPLCPPEALAEVLRSAFPERVELNLQALRSGLEFAKTAQPLAAERRENSHGL